MRDFELARRAGAEYQPSQRQQRGEHGRPVTLNEVRPVAREDAVAQIEVGDPVEVHRCGGPERLQPGDSQYREDYPAIRWNEPAIRRRFAGCPRIHDLEVAGRPLAGNRART
jgi:hypothetical protein